MDFFKFVIEVVNIVRKNFEVTFFAWIVGCEVGHDECQINGNDCADPNCAFPVTCNYQDYQEENAACEVVNGIVCEQFANPMQLSAKSYNLKCDCSGC